MTTEDRDREVYEGTMEEHSLDELAKGLASGTLSRSRAIKLMGAALLGGVLASIPGVALAHHRPDQPGEVVEGAGDRQTPEATAAFPSRRTG
jgi:hypothetical protein